MSLHQFVHEIHLLTLSVFHADPATMYTSLAMLIFALVFLLVGASRWVEFQDFRFSKSRRSILIAMHLIGCLILSLSFALFAIDLNRGFSTFVMALLVSALFLLFPIHIYTGILRRKHLAQKSKVTR
jgi:hypothetical protein